MSKPNLEGAPLYEPGQKFDVGKPRWDLADLDFFEEIVKTLTYGAAKYADDNWKNVERHRYVAALFRHLAAWRRGESCDEESGLPHLAHAACNLMFLYHFDKDAP